MFSRGSLPPELWRKSLDCGLEAEVGTADEAPVILEDGDANPEDLPMMVDDDNLNVEDIPDVLDGDQINAVSEQGDVSKKSTICF